MNLVFNYRLGFSRGDNLKNKIESSNLTGVTLDGPPIQIFSPDVCSIRVVHGYVETFSS